MKPHTSRAAAILARACAVVDAPADRVAQTDIDVLAEILSSEDPDGTVLAADDVVDAVVGGCPVVTLALAAHAPRAAAFVSALAQL